MAYFFLNENITWIQFLGMMIVIIGVSFVSKKEK